MSSENSYIGIAENWYEFIMCHNNDVGKFNNQIASHCQFCIEIYLKALLYKIIRNKSYLKCRRLETLYLRLREFGIDINLDINMLMRISKYSNDILGVPSEGYRNLSDNEAREAYDYVTIVRSEVYRLLNKEEVWL